MISKTLSINEIKMYKNKFLKFNLICVLILGSINSCLLDSKNSENDQKVYDDGKEPPRIYFYDHRLKQETSNYAIEDTAFIEVLDIQMKGISVEGGKVHAKLKTQLGDIENITLFWIGSYLYAGFGSRGTLIHSSILPKSYNGIIEANLNGDTLKAEYWSIDGKFRKAKAAVHP